MSKVNVPDGCWEDATGRFVPLDLIDDIDKTRNELVIELADLAKAQSLALAKFKQKLFADVYAFVDLSAEKYQVKIGGRKGNITLMSFDARYKIQIAISEQFRFNEGLQVAKALIDECITEWAKDSKSEIKMLVQDAFQTDQEGKINTGRVLALRRVKIEDEKWVRAMQAIGQSLFILGSKEYIRFYERVNKTDKYTPILLDIAAV
jgi:Protein of unknown function (DUF3164)